MDVRRLESEPIFIMVKPYDPPISTPAADRPTKTVPFWALLSFGGIPVAIIVSYVIEALLFPTRGWSVEDWFWAVGPPVYLVATWVFALFNHNRNSRKLMVCLAVFMIPLLLYSLRIGSLVAQWFFLSTAGFEDFGINENFRLFAVTVPLWLGASLACTLYFCRVTLKLMRLTAFSAHAEHGEPSREPEHGFRGVNKLS